MKNVSHPEIVIFYFVIYKFYVHVTHTNTHMYGYIFAILYRCSECAAVMHRYTNPISKINPWTWPSRIHPLHVYFYTSAKLQHREFPVVRQNRKIWTERTNCAKHKINVRLSRSRKVIGSINQYPSMAFPKRLNRTVTVGLSHVGRAIPFSSSHRHSVLISDKALNWNLRIQYACAKWKTFQTYREVFLSHSIILLGEWNPLILILLFKYFIRSVYSVYYNTLLLLILILCCDNCISKTFKTTHITESSTY